MDPFNCSPIPMVQEEAESCVRYCQCKCVYLVLVSLCSNKPASLQSGTSIGAVVLSPVCQVLIDRTSVQWALRFLGFLALIVGILATLLVRQRGVAEKHIQYRIFDLSVLRIPGFALYLAFCFLQFFGFVTPLFFIPSKLTKFNRLRCSDCCLTRLLYCDWPICDDSIWGLIRDNCPECRWTNHRWIHG